jgi:hypothetical protein
MDHPPADQVALGNRLANASPNQLAPQADRVCSGISRGRRQNNTSRRTQLADFAFTWPALKDLMDGGGRRGRVNGLLVIQFNDFAFAWPDLEDLMDDSGRSGRVSGLSIQQLGDFAFTWPDLKDFMDEGGRSGRVSGLGPRHQDKISKGVF